MEACLTVSNSETSTN